MAPPRSPHPTPDRAPDRAPDRITGATPAERQVSSARLTADIAAGLDRHCQPGVPYSRHDLHRASGAATITRTLAAIELLTDRGALTAVSTEKDGVHYERASDSLPLTSDAQPHHVDAVRRQLLARRSDTVRHLSSELNLPHETVRTALASLRGTGELTFRQIGQLRIFSLSGTPHAAPRPAAHVEPAHTPRPPAAILPT